MKIEYRKQIDSETAPWQLLTNIDELLWNGVYALRVTDDDGTHSLPFRFANDDTVKTYKVLNCKGLCRIDFFVTKKDNTILLNEANTLPGFTKISMYPKMMIADGMTYKGLISRLIDDAYNSKMR